MAVTAVSEVIKQAAQIGSKLNVEEGSRLYHLKKNIKWIEREMKHFESYLKDADAKQDGDQRVACLVNDIRDLASESLVVLKKFRPWMASQDRKGFLGCVTSATCLCCDCYTAHDFAVEIESIKARVLDIPRLRKTYGINETFMENLKIQGMLEDINYVKTTLAKSDSGDTAHRDLLDPRQPMLHVDEPYVIGFDEDIETLNAKLLDPSLHFRVVSIVGMGGTGKTTLAKKVYQSVRYQFECSAMVTVSQRPEIRDILKHIGKQVGLEEKKMEDNLEANLYSFLRERKYLLLIDDVWHTKALDDLKNGIPYISKNGSRLIVTSRDNGVGRYIGGDESLHALQLLDFENSWMLFSKMMMAPSEDNIPSDLEDIGKQIVKRCGGLPLAIVVTAGILRLKERLEYEWKGVLECMGQEEDQCLRILALSYHDLPDSLKSCFLYLGLFPEDYEYSAFKLINLWVAEGFIQASRGRLVEDIGRECLNKLVARNLIQVVDRNFDGSIETCRIHDLVYRLCFLVGTDNFFFNTLQDVASISGEVRRVTTYHGRISEYWPLNCDTPKLSTFFCFSSDQRIYIEDLKKLCECFKFLVVLVLVVEFWTFGSSKIPNEIGNLIHLTHLQFTGHVRLGHIGRTSRHVAQLPTTITNLKKLLTLDVGGFEVPASIWKMEQLRHLIGYDLRTYSDPFLEISGPLVPHLQTLHMIRAIDLNPHYLYKFTNLKRLGIYDLSMKMTQVLSDASAPMLPKLESLELHGSLDRSWLISNLNLSRMENLREIIITSRIQNLPVFPTNLTRLGLFKTFLVDDPLENLGALPKLKFLQLIDAYGFNYKTKRTSANAGSFPQLQVLEIHQSYHFPNSPEELVVDNGAMPMLKKLIISNFKNLQANIPDRLKSVMTVSNTSFYD